MLEFDPDRPFQPGLMFVIKIGAYGNEAPFRFSTVGYAPVLSLNIRLGWKGQSVTNTLAYYKHL
jgi:hypothetical protein